MDIVGGGVRGAMFGGEVYTRIAKEPALQRDMVKQNRLISRTECQLRLLLDFSTFATPHFRTACV